MKKIHIILLSLFLLSFTNINAQGFGISATTWPLPAGGYIYNSVSSSFYSMYENGSGNTDGSQSWSTLDMNGDGRPDLVVLTERQSGTHKVFGLPNNPYWKVYLNTGAGFSSTALNWPLPSGGYIYNSTNFSFYNFYENGSGNTDGSQAWNILDINGDSKPDLVIREERQAGTYNVFGLPSSPYWKVYLNTGTGFSAFPINWNLPSGGYVNNSINYSFYALFENGSGNTDGSQSWSTTDMNGDGKPDIVVRQERQAGTYNVFGLPANPYWKVYLNLGTGFSAASTYWFLPPGGYVYNSVNYSFYSMYENGSGNTNGSQAWNTTDINGDGKPDIVIVSERQGGNYNVINLSSNPIWKVYLNTGTSFSQSPTNWYLPAGGYIYNSVNYSFYSMHESGSGNTDGSQAWNTTDMNGDHKLDLLVREQRQAGTYNVFGLPSTPYWKVYLNTGTSFSPAATNWNLPAGGYIYNSINYSFYNLFENGSGNTDGSQAWSSTDMNGDGVTDIVVLQERQAGTYNVFNLSTNPNWKVFFGINNSTSIENTGDINSTAYVIYPNPADEELSILANKQDGELLRLKLINNIGQTVYEAACKNSNILHLAKIDLKTLTSGIYFLSICSDNNQQTFKVIKQ